MNNPRILLLMPDHNDIYLTMQTNLIHNGFDVCSLILDTEEPFHYPSLQAWLNVKFQSIIRRDRHLKQLLKYNNFQNKSINYLSSITNWDYALIIRPDLYSDNLLHHIRSRTRQFCAAYQWDGMNRYPDSWKKVGLVDAFYVFDRHDLHNHKDKLRPACNFYFDYDLTQPDQPEFDCYFLGSHLDGRSESITAFAQTAQQNGWHIDMNIYCHLTRRKPLSFFQKIYPLNNIKIIDFKINYQENLTALKNAKVLLDFKTPDHHGLSFRPFEALTYRKKLITTNTDIRHYDFYHPDNIFIWDGKNLDGLPEFMQQPYREPPAEIRTKYGFSNWIKYILHIPPYQPINLPSV